MRAPRPESAATTRRRYLAVAGAATLAGLAGCQNDGSTDDASTTTQADPLDPPSGTSADGIDSVSTLADATREALLATDYALRHEVPLTDSETATITIRSSRSAERQLFELEAPTQTTSAFVAGGTRYVRATADGETNTGSTEAGPFEEVHETDQVRMVDGGEALGGLLGAGDYAPAETVTRNGRRLLRFVLESADFAEDDGISDPRGEAYVSADSVVFEASISAVYGTEETTRLPWAYVIEKLGDVTVEEPDWVEGVRGGSN